MVNLTREADMVPCGGEANSTRFLDTSQVAMIDEALSSLGEYGEVRLVVEKGRLRFLITQRSFDAFKWRPGCIMENEG
jgi:hypothetical protein